MHNGKILWSIDAVNGGYGTPTVFGDLVVFLKEFDAVQAVSAESGIVEWAVQGGHRVRTTLNVIDETLWFGSGSTLLAVNKNGEVVKKLHIPNSFIYGNITPYKGGILCTGTLHNNERDCSCSYLWLINQEGSIMYSMELGRSPVISSDTSGIWLKDDFAFASCGHDIICFDLKVGKELWRTRVFGFCGRHFPVVDSQRVYYTTLKGEVGCADILNGSIVWRQKFREGLIVAPPSIYGKTLFVLADCSVFLLDKDTGEIFQHKVVGHTPYSAVSFGTNKALIGAGEPPANGQLICFDVVSEAHVSLPMYNDVYFLEEKDCNLMSVLIETGGEYTSSSIDVSVFSKDGVVNGKKIGNAFTYKFNLQNNCVSGFYAIPVLLENFGLIKKTCISIYIDKREQLPSSFVLHQYLKVSTEENIFSSGAALVQGLMKVHGKSISQKDFRDRINYVKRKSNWKDADFQTWRLILKRVLSNSAEYFFISIVLLKKQNNRIHSTLLSASDVNSYLIDYCQNLDSIYSFRSYDKEKEKYRFLLDSEQKNYYGLQLAIDNAKLIQHIVLVFITFLQLIIFSIYSTTGIGNISFYLGLIYSIFNLRDFGGE